MWSLIITLLFFAFSNAEPVDLSEPDLPLLYQMTFLDPFEWEYNSRTYKLVMCNQRSDCQTGDTKGGAFCDKEAGAPFGGCKPCPRNCQDTNDWIKNKEWCRLSCDVTPCSKNTKEVCGELVVSASIDANHFCNFDDSDKALGNCVNCKFVNTALDPRQQCLNMPILNSLEARVECSEMCEHNEIEEAKKARTILSDYYVPGVNEPDSNGDFTFNGLGYRFSDMESICPKGEVLGCCAVPATADVCNSPVPLAPEHDLYVTYGFANFEVEDTRCGTRGCVDFPIYEIADDGTLELTEVVEKRCIIVYDSNILGDDLSDDDPLSEDEWFQEVDLTDDNPCIRYAKRRDPPHDTLPVAGICHQGICQITNNTHSCPEPYDTVKFSVKDCHRQNFGFTWDNLGGNTNTNNLPEYDACFQSENAGKCTAFGRQTRDALCTSESWSQGIAGNDQQLLVNSVFYMYFFDPYDSVSTFFWDGTNFNEDPSIGPMGNLGETARCIIGQPEAVDRIGKTCIISETGYYEYKNMDITWFTTYTGEATDPVTMTTILDIPVQTRSLVPVSSCPHGKICAGHVQCYYDLTEDGNYPCSGEFSFCVEAPSTDPTMDPTSDPTMDPIYLNPTGDPTIDPTMDPTEDPTPEAHGDPIIWTFNDECYDLNKNGLYTATYHPTFDHWVNIGVYNDFMREIQVVRSDGTMLLAINNLGMVEFENYPYYFNQTLNDCPLGMKETECPGTYVEFEWDAQDFRYYAQILRHDYLDPALKQGELGYHLDIQPRPFATFEKRRAEYEGLFFSNPLPDELEYCEGGSPH